MDVKTMIFFSLTALAILVFLVACIIMAVDDIRNYRYSKKREKELEKHSEKFEDYYKNGELEDFAKLCATKHVRLHYLDLPLEVYNEKVMCDARERGYDRFPLTENEYYLARKVMNEYGKKED